MSPDLLWNNLVSYSLQIGLLVGLAAFVPAVLRLRVPGARLAYWHILLAACLLLPAVRPWQREIVVTTAVQAPAPVPAVIPSNPAPRPRLPRSEIAVLLLGCGAAARVIWLAIGLVHLRQYRRRARLWGQRAGCPAYLSGDISSPVTFGFLRPVILLPESFPELEEPVREAILCHELLHVERRDWLFTVTEELVRAIFWFHPAIWWLLGEIQLSREQAVDREVVHRTSAREEYLDALLAVAGAKHQPDLAPAPLFLRKRHLRQRVLSIVKEARMSRTRLISVSLVGLAVLAAACWFAAGTFPLSAAPQLVMDAPGVSVDTRDASLLHRAAVNYPEALRKQGIGGTVIVEVTLDAGGSVNDARVLSGPDELRKPALQSVLQWHFSPAAPGTTRQVSIRFQPGETQIVQSARVPATPVPLVRQAAPAAVTNPISPKPTVRTLSGIKVVGLSEEARQELLSKLPVHEGDVIDGPLNQKVREVVAAFDPHIGVFYADTSNTAATLTLVLAVEDVSTSDVVSPQLIRKVNPVYPPKAKEQKISGVVKLAAIIASDGTVKRLEVLSGHPLLVPAALEAVKDWVYAPGMANGVPVEVKTEITVNFTLQE